MCSKGYQTEIDLLHYNRASILIYIYMIATPDPGVLFRSGSGLIQIQFLQYLLTLLFISSDPNPVFSLGSDPDPGFFFTLGSDPVQVHPDPQPC